MTERWGASPEEWAHWKRLGLKADLLPVVSNPHAVISPSSKMKGLGKTPSLYNHNDQVTGFTDWTEHEATVMNLEAWAKVSDFGICIQTRRVRALDTDVPDEALAVEISERFAELVGLVLPIRWRENSGKRLQAFICEDELHKRVFRLPDGQGLVELLATGQQFIANGTHSSGVPYQWLGGLPKAIPEITREQLDAAWAALVDEYAAPNSERRAERRDGAMLEDLDVADPVAEHLIEAWETFGVERGMLYVTCPWKAGHSSDSGDTEAAWLLAGTSKYRHGHFKCQHASCAGRKDAEFFEAVGYRPAKVDDFEDLTQLAELYEQAGGALAAVSPKAKPEQALPARPGLLPLPGFERDNMGRILLSLANITAALKAPQASGCEVAFDEFRGELMIAERPGQWKPLGDADAVRLRIKLEALGFKDRIGKEIMRDALELVGDERRFDSAIEWLTVVVPEWDGVSRISRFLPDYLATDDTPYTRAVGRYAWTAHAGRVLEPGVKADMVPVLVGDQGLLKSSGVAAIAPSLDFFGEFTFDNKEADNARKMRGCLVGELGELRGLQTKDRESILAWIVRRFEAWTPKFKEYETKFMRRLLLWGSTNDDGFLGDPTGERRWLPAKVNGRARITDIVRDRLQLWAEARDTFLVDGVLWAEAEALAKAEHGKFKQEDAWAARVARWLDEEDENGVSPRTSGNLLADDVLVHCVGVNVSQIKKSDQMRIAGVLKQLGMKKVLKRVPTSKKAVTTGLQPPSKVWVDGASDQPDDDGV
ncbi:DNA primase [Caulobacter phage BL94]|nr:DNA primase [Caulobacter phage BL94]